MPTTTTRQPRVRRNGEGTSGWQVYTNPKTGEVQRRYVIKEWVLDPRGARKSKYFTGRLKKDAEARLNEWKRAHPSGIERRQDLDRQDRPGTDI